MDWTVYGLIPNRVNSFPYLPNVQTDSRALPASYSVDSGSSFPGVKQIPPLFLYAFMAWTGSTLLYFLILLILHTMFADCYMKSCG
jgi:hypothetical protein